jgi:hypothetical protein
MLLLILFLIIGCATFFYLYASKHTLNNKSAQKVNVFTQLPADQKAVEAKKPLISFGDPNKYSDIVGKDCLGFTIPEINESSETVGQPSVSRVKAGEVIKSFLSDYPKYDSLDVRKDAAVFPVDLENNSYCAYVVAQVAGDSRTVLYYKMSDNKGKLMEF